MIAFQQGKSFRVYTAVKLFLSSNCAMIHVFSFSLSRKNCTKRYSNDVLNEIIFGKSCNDVLSLCLGSG